jgi:hypothetical protein
MLSEPLFFVYATIFLAHHVEGIMTKVTRSGIMYFVLGLLLLVIRALLHHWDVVTSTIIGIISLDLIRDIGIGCIVLGMFNLILSRADWQEYFEKRLRNIVMGQEFLGSLGASALRQMVRAAIRAQSPGVSVDREGGFLEFFEKHLYQFISAPYRENATAEISYTEDPASPEIFSVIDKFSYTLRNVGSKLQSPIQFELDPSECIDGGEVTISIKIPDQPTEPGKIVDLAKNVGLEITDSGGYRIVRPIPEKYVTLDGIEVKVEATYKASKDRVQTWWILTPTRDLTLILSFPASLNIQVKEFVQAADLANWTRWPGYLKFRYPLWILPGGGIAWGFFPIKGDAKVIDQVSMEMQRQQKAPSSPAKPERS